MGKYKFFKDRLFVFLLSLYLIGIIFGSLLIKFGDININFDNKNYLTIFFANYWYIFLIWIFGFTFIGLFITTIILFFRAFLFGVLIKLLILTNFKMFILLLFLELILYLPSIIFISYVSLKLSIDNFKTLFLNYPKNYSLNKYINIFIVITIIIALYSLIVFMN